ncbi:unnamed protein product [Paramecium pentaurelia]|uniref:SPRY domain-containing protein n=1 Tax=Paramecium pentaurelia TaxID=43138 RepID=A0A8S1TZV7_9CILI|nr:unnamed protein product [Paramecium pentaurelia]
MNILKQTQKQETQSQETICQIHNLDLIAVDLDLSDQAQIKFFCGKCLVDKINNNKLTTIEQSKERIQQIKGQQQDIKIKENQARLNYYKNILDQIMDFKRFVDDTLEKMYKQIQQYMYPIQKEKQELQEYEYQLNYFEDIRNLSELYSQDEQKSQKLIQDINFIDEIQRQFELLFTSSEYFQTLDTFKNTRETIKDIMENNIIELLPLLITKNDSKTPSLSRICFNHKKEIIMIDMDSQNKNIEDRFVCVDCISENPLIKYQTIENVNKQWKEYSSESEKKLQKYKKENRVKKLELLNQIAQMRKNYNKKLNEISEKLIVEQYLCLNKTKESNQIKKNSIQTLNDQQLLKDLTQLIENQNGKEVESQIQIMTNLKNKDGNFKKDIEYHLESLKQYDQQDIQQSLDILKENSIQKTLILKLSGQIEQFKTYQQTEQNQKDQIILIKELQEFIDSANQCEYQLNLFHQIISIYQQHVQKIEQIQQNISLKQKDLVNNQEQPNFYDLNLSKIFNEYVNSFHNNSNQLKKYCNIQQLEKDLIKLAESNTNLEIDKNNQINSMQQQFNQELIDINGKLKQMEIECKNAKEQFEQATQEIINLKYLQEQEKIKIIRQSEEKQNQLRQEFSQKISEKELKLQEVTLKLEEIYKNKLQEDKLKKFELEEYQKSLTFSKTLKHNNCLLSDGGKVISEIINDGNSYYCFCNQAIPKTRKIQFAFQILSGSKFRFGIGLKDIVQKNNYMNCFQFGYGAYFIDESGKTCSHHIKDEHDKNLSFKFQPNDIIIIEVCIEQKFIKFSRLNYPEITVLQIDTAQELYPCLGGINFKIKIMDKVPVQLS